MSKRQRLPGQPAWLVCEWREGGEKKYHLSNYPAQTTLAALARAIRGRWLCEPPHRQMKQELGSWGSITTREDRGWGCAITACSA